jgi:hypothetical protein
MSEITICVFIDFFFFEIHFLGVYGGRKSFSAHDVYFIHSRFNDVKLQGIACNETYLMHYVSSVYSVTIPLHVPGLLVAHAS